MNYILLDKLNFVTNILILTKLGCCLKVIYRTDYRVCYRKPSLAMYRKSTCSMLTSLQWRSYSCYGHF